MKIMWFCVFSVSSGVLMYDRTKNEQKHMKNRVRFG